MDSIRVGRLIAIAAPLAFVSACTLLTSLDGFSDGATPASASDGGADTSPLPVGDGGGRDTSSLVDGPAVDGADPRAQLYASAVIVDHPLGYWRLEETSGTVANDEMGVRAGTYANAPALGELGVAGGRATKLPTGKKATINVPSGAFRFPGLAPSTVELWVKAGVLQNYGALATTEIPQVGAARSGWTVLVDVDGLVHYEVYVTSGATTNQTRGNLPLATALVPGTFHHVVVAYDGSNVIGYYDGVRQSTFPTTGAAPDIGELRWGCRSDDGLCLDDWTIDELAVYDYALPAARVKAHYDLGK